MTAGVIAAMLVFAAFAEVDDPPPAEDPALAADAVATVECGADCSTALRALEAPSAHPACGGTANRELRRVGFCDTGQSVADPLVVLRAPESAGTRACRLYLLMHARRRAQELISEIPAGSTATEPPEIVRRRALTEGSLLADSAIRSCSLVRVSESAEALRVDASAATSELLLTDGPNWSRDYCHAAINACGTLGGTEVERGGGVECLVGNAYIDGTCLRKSQAQLQKLRSALRGVRDRAQPCLAGVNATAATHLQNLLSRTQHERRTQFCCGSTCATNPLGLSNSGGIGSGALADTTGTPNGTGRIRLTNGLLGESAREIEGTLFHEYLHRIGACKHPDHGNVAAVTPRNRIIPASGTSCPSGVPDYGTARVTGCVQVIAVGGYGCRAGDGFCADPGSGEMGNRYLGISGAGMMPVERAVELGVADASIRCGSSFCVARSACPGNPPFFDEFDPSTFDPVYACEAHCYPSGSASEATTNTRRNLCAAGAGATGYAGGTTTSFSFEGDTLNFCEL